MHFPFQRWTPFVLLTVPQRACKAKKDVAVPSTFATTPSQEDYSPGPSPGEHFLPIISRP